MRIRAMAFVVVSLLAVGLVAANSAKATLINGVTTTTGMGTFGSAYCLPCLTNGVGLSSLSLGATHSAAFTDMWMSNGSTTGTLIFDLGAVHRLTTVGIWNYNYPGAGSTLNRGVKTMSVDVSVDNVLYTPLLGPTVIPQGTAAPLPAHIINPLLVNARYVRFNIIDNYGSPNYTGLSEVQFDSEKIVPVRAKTWGQIKSLFK